MYSLDELDDLVEVARTYGLRVHMDGARFANAIAALGCRPADVTWRRGVDVLSFGATKNGAMGAEAVVVFTAELAEPLRFRARRAGQVFSKMRFISAQLEAYVQGGLWLRLAGHANVMARRLADGIADLPGVRLVHPVEINEIFAQMPRPMIDGLLADGFGLYDRAAATCAWSPPSTTPRSRSTRSSLRRAGSPEPPALIGACGWLPSAPSSLRCAPPRSWPWPGP